MMWYLVPDGNCPPCPCPGPGLMQLLNLAPPRPCFVLSRWREAWELRQLTYRSVDVSILTCQISFPLGELQPYSFLFLFFFFSFFPSFIPLSARLGLLRTYIPTVSCGRTKSLLASCCRKFFSFSYTTACRQRYGLLDSLESLNLRQRHITTTGPHFRVVARAEFSEPFLHYEINP